MTTIHDVLKDLKVSIIEEIESLTSDMTISDESILEELINEAEERIFDIVDRIKE